MQFEVKKILLSWVRVPHLAPGLVKNGKMAVEDVKEPADDVLVRAGQRHFVKKELLFHQKIFWFFENLGIVMVGLFRIS